MSDLIPRDAAMDVIKTWGRQVSEKARMALLLRDMQALEPVDVAPVVKCKDCRYAHMTYGGECKYCDFWQEDGGDALYLDGDFYCAAGERKEER